MNSTVLSGPRSSTGKGSEVIFQCNEGLFPSNEITIVCTSKEIWSPDPEGIVCGEQPGWFAHLFVSYVHASDQCCMLYNLQLAALVQMSQSMVFLMK